MPDDQDQNTDTETNEVEETETQPDGDGTPEESEQEAWDPERAKRKIAKANSENRALRERATAAEKKAQGIDEIKQQAQTLGSENLRLKVGYKLGLPIELALRLQGSSEEEMITDAQSLIELVAPSKTPPSRRPAEALRGGGEPEREPEERDLARIADRMFRN